MKHDVMFRVILGGAICLGVAWACSGGTNGGPPDEGTTTVIQELERHDLGQPTGRVRIKVKCADDADGLQVDWAIKPHRKSVDVDSVVTWFLLQSSDVPVVINAKDPADWPFADTSYALGPGQNTSTNPAPASAERPEPYRYSIMAICTESDTSVLDPDVIVRGAGSRDTTENEIR